VLLLATLSSVAFSVLPPSNVARFHRPVAFATMIPTPTSQNPQPSSNSVFQCGGVDGEPFRDTVSGGSSVRLRIFNDASVDADTLDRALKRVTAIYAQIRVRLRWTTTDPLTHDGMPLFDIVITNSAPVQAETTHSTARAVDGVAGSASLSTHRAHAFYGRIRNAAVAYKLFKQNVLADVVAHELGHLLLAPTAHSLWGVMRFDVPHRNEALRTFSPGQGDRIRDRVFAGGIGRQVRHAQSCGSP
jgi:hypothetical protein